jgi:phenylalanyl-tRNA synthetase beta chain
VYHVCAFPINGLQQYVAVDLPPQELGLSLLCPAWQWRTFDNLAPAFQGVVAGRINSTRPPSQLRPPGRLPVDAAASWQLVSGAPNVYEGQAVAVALDGRALPGGL